MSRLQSASDNPAAGGFLRSLLRDRAGNTVMILAGAMIPLLAIIGGGIDMGRSYLSESRLQQACDAGVLAARKKLGSTIALDGLVPAAVAITGNKFFDINYRNGAYGTNNRNFVMTLEADYSISGAATVDVPTTVMRLFAFTKIPVRVRCEARLNFSNTDVMMVLDTTGSMNRKADDSDPLTKIASLRQVVKNFHAQLEGSKSPGTRIRYGFVPYSTNVNVGYLLKSGWMVDNWTYQGREPVDTGATRVEDVWDSQYTDVNTNYTYLTNYTDEDCPDSNDSWPVTNTTTDAAGYTIDTITVNGTYYWCSRAGGDDDDYEIGGTRYNGYIYTHRYKKTGTVTLPIYEWLYKPVSVNVSSLKGATANDLYVGGSIDVPMSGSPNSPTALTGWFRGCIEERDTYQIADYASVDLTRALDLDIDRVPTPGTPATQWRPMLSEIGFLRGLDWRGDGTPSPAPVQTSDDQFRPHDSNMNACPEPARKLDEMDAAAVATYVNGLTASGNTYHDIGMIWGGRLLSSTGIFAAENADVSGKPTNRHLIFLTDGETAPRDVAYSSYGLEPLDQRRWNGGISPFTQVQVVEKRFTVACEEVKKRNITVWVIGFGTVMTDMLKNCAGSGRWFQADNATQLNSAFAKIAASMGDLRISK